MARPRGLEMVISAPDQGFPALSSSSVALANLDPDTVLPTWLDWGAAGDALEYQIHAELLSADGPSDDRIVSSRFNIGPRSFQFYVTQPEIAQLSTGGFAVVDTSTTFSYLTGQNTSSIEVFTYAGPGDTRPSHFLSLGLGSDASTTGWVRAITPVTPV